MVLLKNYHFFIIVDNKILIVSLKLPINTDVAAGVDGQPGIIWVYGHEEEPRT